jgi:hypothetical protein
VKIAHFFKIHFLSIIVLSAISTLSAADAVQPNEDERETQEELQIDKNLFEAKVLAHFQNSDKQESINPLKGDDSFIPKALQEILTQELEGKSIEEQKELLHDNNTDFKETVIEATREKALELKAAEPKKSWNPFKRKKKPEPEEKKEPENPAEDDSPEEATEPNATQENKKTKSLFDYIDAIKSVSKSIAQKGVGRLVANLLVPGYQTGPEQTFFDGLEMTFGMVNFLHEVDTEQEAGLFELAKIGVSTGISPNKEGQTEFIRQLFKYSLGSRMGRERLIYGASLTQALNEQKENFKILNPLSFKPGIESTLALAQEKYNKYQDNNLVNWWLDGTEGKFKSKKAQYLFKTVDAILKTRRWFKRVILRTPRPDFAATLQQTGAELFSQASDKIWTSAASALKSFKEQKIPFTRGIKVTDAAQSVHDGIVWTVQKSRDGTEMLLVGTIEGTRYIISAAQDTKNFILESETLATGKKAVIGIVKGAQEFTTSAAQTAQKTYTDGIEAFSRIANIAKEDGAWKALKKSKEEVARYVPAKAVNIIETTSAKAFQLIADATPETVKAAFSTITSWTNYLIGNNKEDEDQFYDVDEEPLTEEALKEYFKDFLGLDEQELQEKIKSSNDSYGTIAQEFMDYTIRKMVAIGLKNSPEKIAQLLEQSTKEELLRVIPLSEFKALTTQPSSGDIPIVTETKKALLQAWENAKKETLEELSFTNKDGTENYFSTADIPAELKEVIFSNPNWEGVYVSTEKLKELLALKNNNFNYLGKELLLKIIKSNELKYKNPETGQLEPSANQLKALRYLKEKYETAYQEYTQELKQTEPLEFSGKAVTPTSLEIFVNEHLNVEGKLDLSEYNPEDIATLFKNPAWEEVSIETLAKLPNEYLLKINLKQINTETLIKVLNEESENPSEESEALESELINRLSQVIQNEQEENAGRNNLSREERYKETIKFLRLLKPLPDAIKQTIEQSNRQVALIKEALGIPQIKEASTGKANNPLSEVIQNDKNTTKKNAEEAAIAKAAAEETGVVAGGKKQPKPSQSDLPMKPGTVKRLRAIYENPNNPKNGEDDRKDHKKEPETDHEGDTFYDAKGPEGK